MMHEMLFVEKQIWTNSSMDILQLLQKCPRWFFTLKKNVYTQKNIIKIHQPIKKAI